MGTLSCGRSCTIYRHLVCSFFIKTFKIMSIDGYYVANKLITLSCIFFMLIEMKFIDCHSSVMFAMRSMSMCND